MARKVAVMGASGFVGTTLIEHLAGSGEFEVVPFIHRSGSAARLARHGLHSRTIDLLDRDAIKGALASFDVVVNCSRGDKDVMLTGLGNMLDACRHGVASRFVHLSSVAVYGDPPHPDSGAESAPAIPARESYGALKLEQDRMVDAAADHRLQTVILCPPNITGPYSGYLTDILGSIESGRFRLLDEGRWEVNVCDVRNLAEAIVCAMRAENTDRGRFFICDDTPFTWSGLCAELAPLCRAGLPVESMPSTQFVDEHGHAPGGGPYVSRSVFKHLASDEVRAALRLNKRLAAAERGFRSLVRHMGGAIESRMQRTIVGPIRVPKASPQSLLDIPLIGQQLRKIKHHSTRAREVLGYRPPYSIGESFADFRDWYTTYCGVGTDTWRLLVNR